MPRKSIGKRAMTDAERQARYRAARAAGAPVVRTRRLPDHRSRAQGWNDAVTVLTELPGQCDRRGVAGDLPLSIRR